MNIPTTTNSSTRSTGDSHNGMGRHPLNEGNIHWIETGPGPVGDWVSDEELEVTSGYFDNFIKET